MAKRIDPEAVKAEREKKSKQIRAGVAVQDFYDGIGTFHRKGEEVEISQDELDRLKKGGHRLVTSKAAYDARAEADRLEALERAQASTNADELEELDENGDPIENTGSGASSGKKSETKKATSKRSRAA